MAINGKEDDFDRSQLEWQRGLEGNFETQDDNQHESRDQTIQRFTQPPQEIQERKQRGSVGQMIHQIERPEASQPQSSEPSGVSVDTVARVEHYTIHGTSRVKPKKFALGDIGHQYAENWSRPRERQAIMHEQEQVDNRWQRIDWLKDPRWMKQQAVYIPAANHRGQDTTVQIADELRQTINLGENERSRGVPAHYMPEYGRYLYDLFGNRIITPWATQVFCEFTNSTVGNWWRIMSKTEIHRRSLYSPVRQLATSPRDIIDMRDEYSICPRPDEAYTSLEVLYEVVKAATVMLTASDSTAMMFGKMVEIRLDQVSGWWTSLASPIYLAAKIPTQFTTAIVTGAMTAGLTCPKRSRMRALTAERTNQESRMIPRSTSSREASTRRGSGGSFATDTSR